MSWLVLTCKEKILCILEYYLEYYLDIIFGSLQACTLGYIASANLLKINCSKTVAILNFWIYVNLNISRIKCQSLDKKFCEKSDFMKDFTYGFLEILKFESYQNALDYCSSVAVHTPIIFSHGNILFIWFL